MTEPGQDRTDNDGSTVSDCELVIARCQSSPLFDVGKGPLDDVTVLVGNSVERWWASTLAAAVLP